MESGQAGFGTHCSNRIGRADPLDFTRRLDVAKPRRARDRGHYRRRRTV